MRVPLAREVMKLEALYRIAVLVLVDCVCLVVVGAIGMDLTAFFVTFFVATLIGVLLGIYLMSLFLHAVDRCADAKCQQQMRGSPSERPAK
jgi:hypothetical protein